MEDGEIDDYDDDEYSFEEKSDSSKAVSPPQQLAEYSLEEKDDSLKAVSPQQLDHGAEELLKLFENLSEEGEIESDENDELSTKQPNSNGDAKDVATKTSQISLTNICHVCNAEKPKYRCPACEIRTCSLKCCQRHKVLSDCDGSAPRSRMIPLSKYDTLTMLNDYRFLEEAVRLRENCRKVSETTRKSNFLQTWNQLVSECNRRRTKLYKMPFGFEKHLQNKSHFEKFADTVFWNIDWIFVDANNKRVRMERIPETVSLATLLKQILQPRSLSSDYFEVSKQLTNFNGIELISDIKCLMKVERNYWTKDQRYYELNIGQTVKENLMHKTVVEYPTFYACLPTSFSSFLLLTDEMKKSAPVDSFINVSKFRTYGSNNRKRNWKKKRFNRNNKRRRPMEEHQVASNSKDCNGDNANVVVDNGDKDLSTENATHVAQSLEENASSDVVKPLKRLLRVPRQRISLHYRNNNHSGNRNVSAVAHFQNCRQEKKEAVYQLAQELKQNNQKGKLGAPSVENAREKFVEKPVTDKVQCSTKPECKDVPPATKKASIVKTAFFGCLGDDDVSLSDSD